MQPRRYSRYVALGDSTTEGIDDPYAGGGRYRGWADRLAELLAGVNPDLRYANLAIRGRKIGQIHDSQLETALAMRPDLASVVGGVNDVLRRRVDLDYVAETMEKMQTALVGGGATVITMTLPDLSSSMGIARVIGDRLSAYNQLMREVAARSGALLVDMAAEPTAADPRLWSEDRLHANAEGHARIALVAAHTLGVPGVDVAAARAELPQRPPRPLHRTVAGEVAWAWRHLRPWLARRLRGTSSGDGVAPKRPELEPLLSDCGKSAAEPGIPANEHDDAESASTARDPAGA